MNKFFSAFRPFMVMALLFCITSCISKKNYILLQGDQDTVNIANTDVYYRIQPEDILLINVTTADGAVTNVLSPALSQGVTENIPSINTYTVDKDGMIDFPLIGKLSLAGLSRQEANIFFKEKIQEYVKDPYVNIQIMNFRVTILGEVSSPGTYTIKNDRVNILEAIGLAGDLTNTALRQNILLVREEDGKKTMHRLDLTTNEIFSSPYYYLTQNDVIYVEPNTASIQRSSLSPITSLAFSLFGVAMALFSLFYRR